MSLTNNYQPNIYTTLVSTTTNSIQLTVDVGVTNSYLVVAYINQTFDVGSMALPTAYQMKLGNFSASSQFNQVYMVYGSGRISVDISNLTQYKNYSVFYYATVDNPSLTSRHTKVYFQNVQTLTYVIYYLSAPCILLSVLILVLLVL